MGRFTLVTKKIIASFISAVGFLTIIPLRMKDQDDFEYTLGGSFFPLAGLLVGGLVLISAWLFQWLLPRQLSAALIVTVWAGLTGALHLDGLTDCFDGLFVSASKARRLEIMHDSRVGTFGAAGLIIFLYCKIMAIASLPDNNLTVALLLAPVFARLLLLMVRYYPVKWSAGGMGDRFVSSIGWQDIFWGAILPAGIIFLFGWKCTIAMAITWLFQILVVFVAHKRLGKINGDVLGMSVEMCELAILVIFSSQFMLV